MQWQDARALHPDRWLVVEALEAHSTTNRRVIDRLAVLDVCTDGASAMRRYRELNRSVPNRELYFVHTDRRDLVIEERAWVGLRAGHEADASK